ncbi:hypothetical protein GCM10010145_26940 [Streptomyces ruber]|uniref:Uncharacterized protein n=2 Tax=Streptomyces TaxID=1883 RepID=A0A918BB65_9ACTN|nr:hypothetical protein GCM10010145_26940 [Streptomyces ruber]
MRAEQDAAQDEQGDGGQADAVAEPCEDGGGEERPAHGYEGVCVSDGPYLQFGMCDERTGYMYVQVRGVSGVSGAAETRGMDGAKEASRKRQ